MFVIEPTGQNGREPPALVAETMLNADIVYCPTKYSLTHTDASRNAKKKGARIATLPGIIKDVFVRGMNADYNKIKRDTKKVSKKLSKTQTIRIKAIGTDIEITKGKTQVGEDDGDLHPKSLHNLPSGEAFFVPANANGFFTAKDLHLTKKKIKLTFKNGKVVDVNNAKVKKHLWETKNARFVAELGIGTNPGAKLTDSTLEAEKVLGTCHIAVGDSKSMGGKTACDLHWDFIIEKPTMWFNNKKIMNKGKWL